MVREVMRHHACEPGHRVELLEAPELLVRRTARGEIDEEAVDRVGTYPAQVDDPARLRARESIANAVRLTLLDGGRDQTIEQAPVAGRRELAVGLADQLRRGAAREAGAALVDP